MSPRKRWASQANRSYRLTEEEIESKEDYDASFGFPRENRDVYAPEKLIPEQGAWAMVKRFLPAVEGAIDEEVRPGRVFWIERDPKGDAEGFLPNGTYKAMLHSPWGDVGLWPYEYAIVEPTWLTTVWADGELVFHPLNIDNARLNEVTFYARTRGIPLADAAVMALGTLSGPVGWFEPHEELREACESLASAMARMGGPLTEVNHARRAAAHAKRKHA